VNSRRIWIAIGSVVGVLVLLNVVAGGIDRAVGGNEPSGVSGSSYGTQATGLAGLTALLARYDHPVTRARGAVADIALDPASTVFVIQPETLTTADTAQLLEFVANGGRLVVGGSDPFYVHNLRDDPPTWSPVGLREYREIDPRLGDVRVVSTAASGSWEQPGTSSVVAHDGDTALLTTERVGRGSIFFLADASPLENAYLAEADNAAFALGLAGDGRPVTFIEGVHGFGERRGLRALPSEWKIALLLIAAAGIVFAWARGRRFGAPDRPARELPPARAEYVRALSVSLERTHDPVHALAPMQQWARGRVAQAGHLTPDASLEQIDRAAIALGCTEEERGALWHPPTADADALALGRLVARLSERDGSLR
jgi:hypothetical protein